MSNTAALIVAAGAGTRFGGDLPKVFTHLADRPVIAWALAAYDACSDVSQLVLAVARPHLETAHTICRRLDLTTPVRIIAGGPRRQDTVVLGLDAMAVAPPHIVAIHDGARPLIDHDTIARSIRLADQAGACVTAAPVTDTIKQTDPAARVVATPDRRTLWHAQTHPDIPLSPHRRMLPQCCLEGVAGHRRCLRRRALWPSGQSQSQHPAQHQDHHSRRPRPRGGNYGHR